LFKKHLGEKGKFNGVFREVLFAVLDRTPEKGTFDTFQETLKGV
jgi:hypothetical protein